MLKKSMNELGRARQSKIKGHIGFSYELLDSKNHGS